MELGEWAGGMILEEFGEEKSVDQNILYENEIFKKACVREARDFVTIQNVNHYIPESINKKE